ncbi:uncharacterized protein LOC124931656 isoform X2 [Impatiens glandulifera]|uniref:uncharacterized protein LOC124931656 isoform X2 n=1 Tax=Impatiens glandulifera TaxID=253017 RepID=UPI001FB17498|nr:uncharacterized protein LOC124931656 isoform X2 [Impatiens glandulifera]
MVMLCFVLDLRSLSPPLLNHLKQSLLQLANLYSISSPISERERLKPLGDRIGLCYVLNNQISFSEQLIVGYVPKENFNLCDFHQAVNDLPSDGFLPEFNDSGLGLSEVLSNEMLYSWKVHGEDVSRKVVVISSCIVDVDSDVKKILMDAAEKCVSVEFLLLEQKSCRTLAINEKINNFVDQICDLNNCSFCPYMSEPEVFHGLVRRWLQDLKGAMKEPLKARFNFKDAIFQSENMLCCNLFSSIDQIADGFSHIQTCRCHGMPLDDCSRNKSPDSSFCPVTGNDLKEDDVNKSSVKIGEKTVLFLPTPQTYIQSPHVSFPVDFHVIERTQLGSLSEGFIMGYPFYVIPSGFNGSDIIEKSEMNIQFFQGLCSSLHSFDQGLVCSASHNIETMMTTSFQCYYILLPSEKGMMLLRRLAGSEEVSSIPYTSQLIGTPIIEIENSIRASLLKIDVRDFNPLHHERGFHQTLNNLVKASLQCGWSTTSKKEVIIVEEDVMMEAAAHMSDKEKATAEITEEWEKLIVSEIPKLASPTCTVKTKLDFPILSQQMDSSKQLDEKTSRILERLEVPRQLMMKKNVMISSTGTLQTCEPVIENVTTSSSLSRPIDKGIVTSSLPLKPNFQRLKRKMRQ